MSVHTARRAAAASLALAVVAGVSACGSSSSSSASAGAQSNVKAATTGDAHTANITISAAAGCRSDRTSFAAGPVSFKITNTDATAVSEVELLGGERIVGEKENIPPGFTGSFAVSVDAGSYQLYCPGAAVEKTPMTVTGTSAVATGTTSAAALATGTKQYAAYVNTQMGYLVSTSQALAAALKGTDLTAAQNAYKKARPYYERI